MKVDLSDTDTHLLPRSMSSAKVDVKYDGHIFQKMAVWGVLVFHKHSLLKKKRK